MGREKREEREEREGKSPENVDNRRFSLVTKFFPFILTAMRKSPAWLSRGGLQRTEPLTNLPIEDREGICIV